MKYNEVKKLVEALVFSAGDPLSEKYIESIIKKYGNFDIKKILLELESNYQDKGINLFSVDKKWFFKTNNSLSEYLRVETDKKKKLSKSALETLAIIAYHQPVTRAEIEKVRGKSVFRGTLDMLLELKWIKPNGRRETPGRPVTWTTDLEFLKHFGLKSIKDLPKVDELVSFNFD
tara:strand:- start:486 stop:1010 length:525 start_codon:yes stop_codon:yes gene_type:complete